MRGFTAALIAASVALLAMGLGLVCCIFTAHAVERDTVQFVTSPNDVTNRRVLEQRTAAKMGALALEGIVQVQEAMAEAAEAEQEAAYEPEWYGYSDYGYSGGSGDYSGGWRYTEYYPSENTGAFAYAPGLDIMLGDDGAYRDKDGYVVVASSSLGAFETVDTPYGEGRVYDRGCAAGVVDIYTNNG